MSSENEKTFERSLLESPLPVLVDFWAPWCGPCKQIGPVLERIAKDLPDKINLRKINVDDNPLLATSYGIKAIPTMILFVDGKEKARLVGAVPRAEIINLIDEHLSLSAS